MNKFYIKFWESQIKTILPSLIEFDLVSKHNATELHTILLWKYKNHTIYTHPLSSTSDKLNINDINVILNEHKTYLDDIYSGKNVSLSFLYIQLYLKYFYQNPVARNLKTDILQQIISDQIKNFNKNNVNYTIDVFNSIINLDITTIYNKKLKRSLS